MFSKPKHIVLLLLATFILSAPLVSQEETFQVTPYDEISGLQSTLINGMLQDSRGYLWFATSNGLYRYDGYNFKVFRKIKGDSSALPENTVLRIVEDHYGKIWLGFTKEKISCYDPATGKFRSYNVNRDGVTYMSSYVSMLFVDKSNTVWVGLSQKGFLKLEPSTGATEHYNIISDTNTFYSKELRNIYNSTYAMCQDTGNIYWIATHDGLYKFNALTSALIPIRAKPLQRSELRDDLFGSILPDKNGVWLGSWAGGLSYYNISTNRWSNYKFDNRKSKVATTNIISDIKLKSEHELWITSNDRGWGVFNILTKTFTFFGDDSMRNKNIPNKFCYKVMQDNQDNIWLGYQDGLMKVRLNEIKFRYVRVPVTRSDNGEYYEISCMLEDKAGRWLFTGTTFADGLHITDKKNGTSRTLAFNVSPQEENLLGVADMLEDSRGNIWVLTRDYVYQYDQQKHKLLLTQQPPPYTKDVSSNFFTRIAEDKNGNIWIASGRNGAFRYNEASKKWLHYFSDTAGNYALPSNILRAIATDIKGRVWLGGSRGSFGYFDATESRFVTIDINGRRTRDRSDNRIYCLLADSKGDIWAGTEAGLCLYNAHEDNPRLVRIYDAETGLPGDVVSDVDEDKNGDIWCCVASGISRINRRTNSVTNYGKLDGITKNTNVTGLYRFADGRMTLFASAGYYMFNPDALEFKQYTVPLAVTAFKIDDKEQYLNNVVATEKIYSVPAEANVVSFEFAALDFVRSDKQEYAYMLEGFDKDWVNAGRRRYVGYANLPGGDYNFKIKATNKPGDWNVPAVSIPFHVAQPFYKTWWFLVLLSVIVFNSMYIFYRYKLKKQQQIMHLSGKASALEKEKALVMYESLKQHLNPHFLFNSLTSLSSLIRFDQKLAGNFLDGLSKIYRYILKSRDRETVPLVEEIKFVETFIQLQKIRFEKGFIVNICVPETYYNYKIAPVTLQNLIENAIKHNIIDEESPLEIDIFVDEEYLVVKNNLQKKNFVETSNKQGLVNLQSLYNYLSTRPVMIGEDTNYFFVKIPLV